MHELPSRGVFVVVILDIVFIFVSPIISVCVTIIICLAITRFIIFPNTTTIKSATFLRTVFRARIGGLACGAKG